MTKALLGIVGFTLIETVVLVVWLVLAGLPFNGHAGAAIVLFVGLFFEHIAAYNVGGGRAFFRIPR